MKFGDLDALSAILRAEYNRIAAAEQTAPDEELKARLHGRAAAFIESRQIVDALPTVDAVIVTRCKDCAFMGAECNCTINRRQTQPGGYCDRGVRWDA